MKKVITIGEIMLRLSTPGYQKIKQSESFDIHYGGGEANVAIGLAQLGIDSSFVTKVPDNELGHSCSQFLSRYGVDTKNIIFGGDRLGIYFLEKGFSIRPSKILYDRKESSFYQSKVSEYALDAILADAQWLHISGITPALNKELFELTKAAVLTAKKLGLTVSCDLNYRSSLWTFEEARKKMAELMENVDVCIGIEPLELLDSDGIDIKDKLDKKSPNFYEDVAQEIYKKFNLKNIALTFRNEVSVNHHLLKAVLYDGDKFYKSSEIEVDIVDRVGTGDAFSTGLVYSLINDFAPQKSIDFAATCFAFKHTIEGDASVFGIDEINHFVENNGSLSIKR